MQPPDARRYAAFISYNHADRERARWLHARIESFRVPRALRGRPSAFGTVGARIAPVFLDRDELSTSADLASSVREALSASAFLIVVCSPASARSRWVNEEVRHFKQLGRQGRILPIIVAGEPRASAGAEDETSCFPPALVYEVVDGAVTGVAAPEPLAADLRPGMDDPASAVLKLAAAIIGVPFDELRRRERARRQKRLVATAALSAAAAVVFAVLAATAWIARGEAETQRALAEQKSRTAQRTAEFLQSLFRVSDPSEARGNSVTAREILDRGARTLATELRDEPAVRADLSTTLGQVYAGLGLLPQARELLQQALATPSAPPLTVAQRRAALAELEFLEGRFAEAERLFALSVPEMERHPEAEPGAVVRALSSWGEALANLERYADAREHHRKAARIAETRFGRNSAEFALALEGSAYAAFYAGDFRSSRAEFAEALEIRRGASGADHPETLETLNQLGAVEYMLGDRDAAARHMRESLAISRRVLGDRHIDLAQTLNNVGRIELERRRFAEAARLLEEALAVHLAQRSETIGDVIFTLANLAVVRARSDRFADADELYARALRSAAQTGHRLRGPILTDWAELDCRRGRTEAADARLAEARPLIAERYPDEPWREALVDSVAAECALRRGKTADAERLLRGSNAALLAKWPPETLYGYDVVQRNTKLYELTRRPEKLEEFRRELR